MDLLIMYSVVILYILKLCVTGTAANLNSTDTGQSTTTPTTTTASERDRLFGNPFWIGFTVILFICIVVVSTGIAVTYGVYKFRKEAKKRGHYKHKSRVDLYRETEDKGGPDYELFTTSRDSPQREGSGESNVAYLGSA